MFAETLHCVRLRCHSLKRVHPGGATGCEKGTSVPAQACARNSLRLAESARLRLSGSSCAGVVTFGKICSPAGMSQRDG